MQTSDQPNKKKKIHLRKPKSSFWVTKPNQTHIYIYISVIISTELDISSFFIPMIRVWSFNLNFPWMYFYSTWAIQVCFRFFFLLFLIFFVSIVALLFFLLLLFCFLFSLYFAIFSNIYFAIANDINFEIDLASWR